MRFIDSKEVRFRDIKESCRLPWYHILLSASLILFLCARSSRSHQGIVSSALCNLDHNLPSSPTKFELCKGICYFR